MSEEGMIAAGIGSVCAVLIALILGLSVNYYSSLQACAEKGCYPVLTPSGSLAGYTYGQKGDCGK